MKFRDLEFLSGLGKQYSIVVHSFCFVLSGSESHNSLGSAHVFTVNSTPNLTSIQPKTVSVPNSHCT